MAYIVQDLSGGSGFTSNAVAGETLETLKLVHLNGSGEWVYADASAEASMPAVALTLGEVSAGRRGSVLLLGKIQNNGWGWTPGALLYASTVAGGLTETAPSKSGEQVQVVAKALSHNLLLFNPSYVIVEVS